MKTLNLENMGKYGINMTQNAPTNRFPPNNIPGVLVGIAVLTVCLQSLCTVKWSRSFFSLPSLQVWCFARISDLWQGRKPDIEGWKNFTFACHGSSSFWLPQVLYSLPIFFPYLFHLFSISFSIFFPYRFPYLFHIFPYFRESGPPRKIWKIWKTIWNLGIWCKKWKNMETNMETNMEFAQVAVLKGSHFAFIGLRVDEKGLVSDP